MKSLKKQQIAYLAAEHSDHAPHRHLHVLAIISGRLNPNDFRLLREAATSASLTQRQERDLAQQDRDAKQQSREEAQWDI